MTKTDSFKLIIELPKVDVKGFDKAFTSILKTLDKADKRVKSLDKSFTKLNKTMKGFKLGGAKGGSGGKGGSLDERFKVSKKTKKDLSFLQSFARGASAGGFSKASVGINVFAGSMTAANIAAAGLAATLAGGAIVLIKAGKAAAEFEDGLVRFGVIANLTTSDLKAFGDELIALSTELPVTTKALLELSTVGASGGLRGRNLKAFVTEMAKLKVLLPGISETQIRGIQAIAQLTNFPVERIGELNNAFLKLQNNTKALIPQMINAGNRLVQLTGDMNLGVKDVLAFSAAIGELGQGNRPRVAVKGISTALKELVGLSLADASKLIKGMRDDVGLTAEEFKELGRVDPAKALRTLGTFSKNIRNSLSTLGVDTSNQFGAALEQILSPKNIAKIEQLKGSINVFDTKEIDAAAAKIGKTVSSRFRKVGSGLFEVFKPVGEAVGGVIVSGLELGLGGLKGGIKEFEAALGVKQFDVLPLEEENRLLNAISKKRAELIKQGQDILKQGASRENEKEIDKLQKQLDEFITAQIKITKEFKNISTASESEFTFSRSLKKELDSIQNLKSVLDFSFLRSKNDLFFRNLNGDIAAVAAQLDKFDTDIIDIQLEVDEFNLTPLQKEMNKILRDANTEFTALLGDSILTGGQETKLIERFNQLSTGEDITADSELNKVLEKIKESTQGKEDKAQLEIIVNRLLQSNKVQDKILEKRNKLIELNTLKQAAAVKRNSAPSVSAITNVGDAIEHLNKLAVKRDIQKEQLAQIQKQTILQKELVKQFKNTKIVKVASK